jgi:para-nitrobenzyl esterase
MMASYWTNFAKGGDPNGEGLPRWPALADGKGPALSLAATPAAGDVADQERLKVFDEVYATLRTAPTH